MKLIGYNLNNIYHYILEMNKNNRTSLNANVSAMKEEMMNELDNISQTNPRMLGGLVNSNLNHVVKRYLMTFPMLETWQNQGTGTDFNDYIKMFGQKNEELNKELTDLEKLMQKISAKLDKEITPKALSTDANVKAEALTRATEGSFTIDVNALATRQKVGGNVYVNSTTALGYVGIFELNGIDFTVSSTHTLEDIKNMINTANIGITADIDDGLLTLESDVAGVIGEIAAQDITDNILFELGILNGSGNFKNEIVAAQDATYKINGGPIQTASGNSIIYNQVKLEFLGTTTSPATITVTKEDGVISEYDKNKIMEETKKFITELNNVIKHMNAKPDYFKEDTFKAYEKIYDDNKSELNDMGISKGNDGLYIIDEAKLDSYMEASYEIYMEDAMNFTEPMDTLSTITSINPFKYAFEVNNATIGSQFNEYY